MFSCVVHVVFLGLLTFCYVFHMVFLCFVYVYLCCVARVRMRFACLHRALLCFCSYVFLCSSYGLSYIFLCFLICFQLCSYIFVMFFQWFSYVFLCFPMIVLYFLWFSYDCLIFSYVFQMVFLHRQDPTAQEKLAMIAHMEQEKRMRAPGARCSHKEPPSG